jgi:ABC-type spermidine/putrescine transport system permease subunit I
MQCKQNEGMNMIIVGTSLACLQCENLSVFSLVFRILFLSLESDIRSWQIFVCCLLPFFIENTYRKHAVMYIFLNQSYISWVLHSLEDAEFE